MFEKQYGVKCALGRSTEWWEVGEIKLGDHMTEAAAPRGGSNARFVGDEIGVQVCCCAGAALAGRAARRGAGGGRAICRAGGRGRCDGGSTIGSEGFERSAIITPLLVA